MAMLSLKCPHCDKDWMTFDVQGFRGYGSNKKTGLPIYSVTLLCRHCALGVALVIETNQMAMIHGDPTTLLQRDVDVTRCFNILRLWPKPNLIAAPTGVSVAVERAFIQGEDNRQRKNYEAAGTMYRKALDTASKELGIDLKQTKNLQVRLRLLLEAGKLTPQIAEWADHIRLLGNDAAHEEDEPAEKEIDDLANLTRMALIYLFEMPKKIADMRAEAVASGAEGGTG